VDTSCYLLVLNERSYGALRTKQKGKERYGEDRYTGGGAALRMTTV
jgi:bisphosphoglycerate-dependent phosphoglycerate mutase